VNDEEPSHGGETPVETTDRDSTPSLSPSRVAIAERLAAYDAVLEVGIGRQPGVAAALVARGLDVVAVDVEQRPVPEGVQFVRDDVVEIAERAAGDGPSQSTLPAQYRVDAVYALNLPPELHRPTLALAEAVDAAFVFTTLGGDPAIVPARTETIGRETLYVPRE
jgi:uncharacterized UPF0146 family protein